MTLAYISYIPAAGSSAVSSLASDSVLKNYGANFTISKRSIKSSLKTLQ